MDEYARLKWAQDPRWTNARKRDAQKSLAVIGQAAAEARAECQRSADDAAAVRLTQDKLDVAKQYYLSGNARLGKLLTDVPEAHGRAGYELMDTADAVERSLASKLARNKQRLADCRTRVTEKTAGLARLQARMVHSRFTKSADEEAAEAAMEAAARGPGMVAATEKTVDALTLCNRQMAGTSRTIADNEAMYMMLHKQLETEVRQQAATVIELISYGSTAQQKQAEFDRRYCETVAMHNKAAHRKAAITRNLKTNIATMESNRNTMMSKKMNEDLVQKIDFDINVPANTTLLTNQSRSTSNIDFKESPSTRLIELTDNDLMSFIDWIDNGPMENYMFRKEEDNMINSDDSPETDTEKSLTQYTYPVDKVNLLKFGNKEHTRAMEAVEYVCDTLDFSDVAEVQQYLAMVKRVEIRIKKMVDVRKHLCGVARKNLKSATDMESDKLSCVPESTLQLDVDIERVKRDGLEVQKKQLRNVTVEISEYGALFNELWFQLDNLMGKLDRCHVPTVRRYKECIKNPAKCTELMANDADFLLDGLCLTTCDVDGDDTDRTLPSAPGTPPAWADRHQHHETITTTGWKSAVDACRKLVVKMHDKVKSCMGYVGGRSFDVTDGRQLTARAYFTFKQQLQIQNAVLKKMHENQPSVHQVEAAEKDPEAVAAAAGILTREQTKHQAEEIVEYFNMPKDADNVKRSRKPISFRKSRIVV